MSWITVIWSMLGSACLTLALMHFFVWFKQRRQWAHLSFSMIAVAVAVITAMELMAMRAVTVEQMGTILRWVHLPNLVVCVGIVCFVRFYFDAGRLWLAVTACGLRALALVLSFTTGQNLFFTEVTSLKHVAILGGETISIARGVLNPWYVVGPLSILVLIVFVVDASIAIWQRGNAAERRRVVVVSGTLTSFLVVAVGHAALVNAGIIDSPYIVGLAFMPTVAAVAYELSADMLRAAHLANQLRASQAGLRESEQRMHLVASAAELGLWVWDIVGDKIWSTDRGLELFGFTKSERIDLNRFLATLHPDDLEKVRRGAAKAMKGDGDYQSEYRIHLPDGQTRWIAARGRVQFNSGGKPILMRGVSFDITSHKQADEHFRLVVEAAPNAMIMGSLEGRIILVNHQTEAIFGYTRKELVGHSIELLVPERFRPFLPGQHNRHLAEPMAWSGRELFGRRKDGSEVPIEIGLNPITTSEGMFVLASIIDTTDRKQAERKAQQQRDELAHLSRVTMLGELSGSLAHELNQPLAAILSNAQAAQRFLAHDRPDLDEVREILKDIVDEDKRAGEVILRLRLLLKKGEVSLRPLDMNEVVQDVLKLVGNDLVNQSVTVRTELATALPVVSADRVQMQQVLLNLVMNGCDAMAGEDATDRLIIVRTAWFDGQSVRVSVADKGHGIPPDKMERVFEPFLTTKPQGMGLGLAVCRSIITAHGGRLWAMNNVDRGAIFHFTLPVNSGMEA